MMTRAQCCSCNARMNGIVASESYIYCDWCTMKALRWMHERGVLDGNPLGVYLGLHGHSKATNHNPINWHCFLMGDALNPPEFIRVQWPATGGYSYESQVVEVDYDSIALPKDLLDSL